MIAYVEKNGAPEEVRTPNLLIRSQVLYPVELRARPFRKSFLKKTPEPSAAARHMQAKKSIVLSARYLP